jgi:diguanylate cyclase (GGDEF)-like protein
MTALRHVHGQRAGAVPVVELLDISAVGAVLGIKCRTLVLPALAERVDVGAMLRQLHAALLATTRDPASQLMRAVVLYGQRPFASPTGPQDSLQFLRRVRTGIGGFSESGRALSFAVAGRRGVELVMFVSNPKPYVLTPDGWFHAQRVAGRFGTDDFAQRMANGGTVTTHHDITEQRRSEAKIAHMAVHDTLTGLPNRVLLNERLEQALTRVKRGEMVAAHILDLDHFKHVNDTLGHPAGDKLLRMVADRLRGLLRETDTVARMGGDEFAIVQVAIAAPTDATVLAHRIIAVVSEPYDVEGHQVVIGASIGIAVGPSDGVSSDEIMRNADLALYRAKGDGRGAFRFFEPEMDAQMQARRALECDLRKALPASEFELYYQPVVDLATNKISGFEALIRWHHPRRGLVTPGTFIPLAEETGLIVPLGEWAIRQACATAASWPANLKIAVNLSPAQFRSPGLLQAIINALAVSGLAPGRLELEITETILLQDSEATLATLYQLRDLGVRIVMDDFGTGYSSLSYLQSFPFDKIKIDRSFVKDIADNPGSLNIVRAVAALAKGLGMSTTAEGVETAEQLDSIRSEGCSEMQGFLFSRPIPPDDLEAWLKNTILPRRAPWIGQAGALEADEARARKPWAADTA